MMTLYDVKLMSKSKTIYSFRKIMEEMIIKEKYFYLPFQLKLPKIVVNALNCTAKVNDERLHLT